MSSRVFIIEGTDGTGKTTLAEELSLAYSYDYVHAGPPAKESWYEEYVVPILQYSRNSGVVLDRWHLGEWVWPIVFGRDSLYIDERDALTCHSVILQAVDPIVIVLTRGIAAVREERKKDNPGNAVMGEAIYEDMIGWNLGNTVFTDLNTARRLFLP